VHFVHKIIALLGLFLVTVSITFGQNIEKEMKKSADKLFAEEQYVAATSTYLNLLSLHPSSSEYNYKYGACLLYNSAKKQTAIKFLATAVTDPAVDPIAYYFLGKAFHLNFQFNSAITNYQIFLTKSSDEVRKKEVRRQLEMCENGKKLLRQLSDLVVLEKKETDPQNFFRSYNLENIGGSIVVAADFQTKVDLKRKHIPVVYFPANSDTVYY
jgi:tetratricopeptide (TPR) repeat protein